MRVPAITTRLDTPTQPRYERSLMCNSGGINYISIVMRPSTLSNVARGRLPIQGFEGFMNAHYAHVRPRGRRAGTHRRGRSDSGIVVPQ